MDCARIRRKEAFGGGRIGRAHRRRGRRGRRDDDRHDGRRASADGLEPPGRWRPPRQRRPHVRQAISASQRPKRSESTPPCSDHGAPTTAPAAPSPVALAGCPYPPTRRSRPTGTVAPGGPRDIPSAGERRRRPGPRTSPPSRARACGSGSGNSTDAGDPVAACSRLFGGARPAVGAGGDGERASRRRRARRARARRARPWHRCHRWGFPYLWDPAGDAEWTAQNLDWRSAGGDRSTATAPTSRSRPRASCSAPSGRPCTSSSVGRPPAAAGRGDGVPPTDANWDGGYPDQAMAPYVDAFAPMVSWECTDPGSDDRGHDIARLTTLRPVHVIGQAFNFSGPAADRLPEREQIAEFLSVGKWGGSAGGSFWVWQEATPDEWPPWPHPLELARDPG